MSGLALLDVNVLVALLDPEHIHHDSAHVWFGASRAGGWATCPITENGALRILSSPQYSSPPFTCQEVAKRLMSLLGLPGHVFWEDHISLCDAALFDLSRSSGRQLTDIYLLGLAVKNAGRLATFDTRISLSAVVGAEPRHLTVIPVLLP